MTLEEVAARCDPPTTPQTIGRLETGSRTLSVPWLNRIANALGVMPSDLVETAQGDGVQIVAVLSHAGVNAPRRPATATAPRAGAGLIAIDIATSVGDYRSGDQLWCRRIEPDGYAGAINRDILLPRPGGRFLFGRLIGRDEGRLQILPLGAGQRQTVIADPSWAAVATTLIRSL